MIKLIKKSGRHRTRDSPMPIGISANEHWSPLLIEKHVILQSVVDYNFYILITCDSMAYLLDPFF
ncbi:hypothetical protein AVL55_09645 [Alteromonas macleodii]|uniref:Uncharacterized protein n=1 Tax=Alteromonas macleodii TaxID=28108 RepID=A0A126PZG0_ALTMA|nr:hypothetical protein AVL55_09645 [Alteromonas macleodii]MEC9478756.1 hypothetical protein [Pseudomonadota bacterium]